MSHEITELNEAIEGISEDDAVGSSYFTSCIEYLGRRLADRTLSLFGENPIDAVRVVCSNEDYDLLAVPFASVLRDQNIQTAISCVWSIYEEPTEFLPAKSVLVGQAHNEGPSHVYLLVTLCSSLLEPAVVADNFSRASDSTHAEHHLVVSPFDALDSAWEVREELKPRSDIDPDFIDLTDELTTTPNFDLLLRTRNHLQLVYGRQRSAFLPHDFGGPGPRYENRYEPEKYTP